MNLTQEQWREKQAWLLSLGMDRETIKLYRLDQYQYMTDLAWDCMVREAFRSTKSLRMEQRRRKHANT